MMAHNTANARMRNRRRQDARTKDQEHVAHGTADQVTFRVHHQALRAPGFSVFGCRQDLFQPVERLDACQLRLPGESSFTKTDDNPVTVVLNRLRSPLENSDP